MCESLFVVCVCVWEGGVATLHAVAAAAAPPADAAAARAARRAGGLGGAAAARAAGSGGRASCAGPAPPHAARWRPWECEGGKEGAGGVGQGSTASKRESGSPRALPDPSHPDHRHHTALCFRPHFSAHPPVRVCKRDHPVPARQLALQSQQGVPGVGGSQRFEQPPQRGAHLGGGGDGGGALVGKWGGRGKAGWQAAAGCSGAPPPTSTCSHLGWLGSMRGAAPMRGAAESTTPVSGRAPVSASMTDGAAAATAACTPGLRSDRSAASAWRWAGRPSSAK